MAFTGATNYPGSLDAFDTTKADADPIGQDVVDVRAAAVAIETELGTNPSGSEASVTARLAAIEAQLGGGGSTFQELAIADGADGLWLHNETSGTTSSDLSGNTNHGTYTGGFTLNQSDNAGGFSKSVLLNGSSGYVTVPDHATLDFTTACTLEIFVKPDITGGTGERGLVSKGGVTGYLMELYQTGLLTRVNNSGGTDVGIVPMSGWNHVAIAYNNVHVHSYINGVLVDRSGAAGPITPGSDPLLIGQYAGGQWLKGLIGPAAVYNTYLGPNQIRRHYLAGIGATVA